MSLFSKKVMCSYCGKNHKSKKARGKTIYVCSTYDNYGKDECRRNKVDEILISELIERRFKFREEEFAPEKVQSIEASEECLVINIEGEERIFLSYDKANF